ncbi:MAG: DUF2378 family protein [Myxococcales bacterium]
MADEKLVFEQTFDGMFHRALKHRVTPRLKERLRGLGVDLDQKLLPAYPVDVWDRALVLTAEELYPGQTLDAALRQLGTAFIYGYQENFLGRAVMAAMRVVGPRRALDRMSKTLRSADNFSTATLVERSPTHCELTLLGHIRNPHFFAGTLVAGAQITGAKDEQIDVLRWDATSAVYSVRWR